MVLLELIIVWLISIYLLYNGIKQYTVSRQSRNRVNLRSLLRASRNGKLQLELRTDGSLWVQETDRSPGEGTESDENTDGDEYASSDEIHETDGEFISTDAQRGASDYIEREKKD